ncbi:MAG TPA: hypothetical protein V6C72_18980, partial [Chroococcales cyanobacterium]
MSKLAIRSKLLPFVAFSAFLGALVAAEKFMPTMMTEQKVGVLGLIELVIVLAAPAIIFRHASPAQFIKLSSSIVAFGFALGAIGCVVLPITRVSLDGQLLAHWAELVIIPLGGVLTTLAAFEILPADGMIGAVLEAPGKGSKEAARDAKRSVETPKPAEPAEKEKGTVTKTPTAEKPAAAEAVPMDGGPRVSATNLRGLLDTLT